MRNQLPLQKQSRVENEKLRSKKQTMSATIYFLLFRHQFIPEMQSEKGRFVPSSCFERLARQTIFPHFCNSSLRVVTHSYGHRLQFPLRTDGHLFALRDILDYKEKFCFTSILLILFPSYTTDGSKCINFATKSK